MEPAKGNIKYMLVGWIPDNTTIDWPVGIKFVQLCLPTKIIVRLQSDDDLLSAMLTPSKGKAEVDSDLTKVTVQNRALPGPRDIFHLTSLIFVPS